MSNKIQVLTLISNPHRKEYFINRLNDQNFFLLQFFEDFGNLITYAQNNAFSQCLLIIEREFLSFDLNYFISQVKTDAALLLQYAENNSQELVEIDNDYRVTEISKKDLTNHDGYIDSGIYLLSRDRLLDDIFIKKNGRIHLNLSGHTISGIPVPENIGIIKFGQERRTLFLDRDGVINVDGKYIHLTNEINLYEEIIPLIKYANESDWHVVVVSNQSGVARGYFTEQDVLTLHSYIDRLLLKKNARIDRWLYCPFHFEKGKGIYKKRSLLRKPDPGMILNACDHLQIDLENSIMVGDKVSDIIKLPGLTTVLIQREYDLKSAKVPIFDNYDDILRLMKR